MVELNPLQRLCTDLESSSAELVLEPLYGVRQWTVHSNYTGHILRGHNNYGWDLREESHLAACAYQRRGEERTNLVLGQTVDGLRSAYLSEELAFQVTRDLEFPADRSNTGLTLLSVAAAPAEPQLDPATEDAYKFSAPATRTLFLCGQNAYDQVERAVRAMLLSQANGIDETLRYAVKARLCTYVHWEHRPAEPSCTCGFYAYHTRRGLAQNVATFSGVNVFGLVRATGRVTLGKLGLRAERCEIVALTAPLVSVGGPGYAWYTTTDNVDAQNYAHTTAALGLRMLPSVQALLELAREYNTMIDSFEDVQLYSVGSE